jgi:hypothetical protein
MNGMVPMPNSRAQTMTQEELSRMFELWGELDKVMLQTGQFLYPGWPWQSTHPQVVAAWEALTRPEHLSSLEAWFASGDYGRTMNDYAAETTREAIKVSRQRAGM